MWSATAPLDTDQEMSANITSALGGLLDSIPKKGWPAMRVKTAVDLPWGRVKLVRGVPSVRRHGELIALLRLNTSRFVASSRPVIITGANVTSPGEACIGIVDLSVVQAITTAIMSRKLCVGQIVPVAGLEADRNIPTSSEMSASAGAGASEVIATRIAGTRRVVPLALRARDNPAALVPDASRRRVATAAIFFAAALLVYFGNQLRIERSDLTQARNSIRRLAVWSDSGIREDAELGHLAHDLATATNFSRHRVSAALLLGAITQALPADAAITTLRIDTASVDIVALSPRTADVVDALSDVPEVATPTIIGPVSRETVGTQELERATIRLRISPDYNRGKIRFAVERDGGR